jgi:hypothetical protein
VDQTLFFSGVNYRPPHPLKKNVFNSREQKMIMNVLHFIKTTKETPALLEGPTRNVAAKALGVGARSLSRLKRRKTSNNGLIITPKTKRAKVLDAIDSFDIVAIKTIILDFYRDK